MGLLKARSSEQGLQAPTVGNPYAEPDNTPDKPRLDHPDAILRRRAVQELAGNPANTKLLIDVLRRDPDNLVRQAAFLALASLNTATVAEAVAALLSEADAALRNGALETLAAMPDHAGALLPALGAHPDPDVRIFAILLAGELDSPDTADWLIALAGREEDPNVCSNLAEALGGSGRTDAASVLETVGARFPDEPFLAFAVETAIQRLREA